MLRELKAQARRDQAKKLVMDQLSQLKVQSDTLLTEINYLGEPVVQLTDKEKALFKDASLEIPDVDDSSMAISIAAPKQTSPAPIIDTVTNPAAANSSSATAPSPSENPPAAAGSPASAPTPPMDLAKLTLPVSPDSALSAPRGTPAGTPAPSSSTPSALSTPSTSPPSGDTLNTAGGGPMVPPELLDDAKSAKDAFERGEYREAEKIYERMLTL